MYHKAKKHFKKVDPQLHRAALLYTIQDLKRSPTVFKDVVQTIIGQQLSGKAADTIFGRLEARMPKKKVTSENVLRLRKTALRACGISGAKSNAIRDFAQKVKTGELNLKKLPLLTDEEVRECLTRVKGIGPWTAEMILMFSLGREDVFSHGDLGLRKGLVALYGFKKFPNEKKLETLVGAWSPYRTYAARVLWKIADRDKT